MIRFGLCCVFRDAPIHFRTITALNLSKSKENASGILSEIILSNLQALEQAIIYCSQHAIGAFRITSRFLPLYTHPMWGYSIDSLLESDEILKRFQCCKTLAKEREIRLIFHPDQFVVLNSPRDDVVKSSLAELEYHGLVAELLGVDTINIHAGGSYGDKKSALMRLERNMELLSSQVRTRLTLENDDRRFTPQDLFPLCKKMKIPLLYDVHHHRCLEDEWSIEKASQLAYESWNREPIFHLSSPLEGWSGKHLTYHHDEIDFADFPLCWLNFDPLTIEVEAKAKEVAIFKLQERLKRASIR